MKRSIFSAAAAALSLSSAQAYSSPTMHKLSNYDLSAVVGQADSAAVLADPYQVYLDQLRYKIQQLLAPRAAESAQASFDQIFKVNEQGELWMSVQRNHIAISTIECSLSFKGMQQGTNSMMSEIKFY